MQKVPFEVLQKNQVHAFTRVVWAEDSKTGLGFEIEPLQQNYDGGPNF